MIMFPNVPEPTNPIEWIVLPFVAVVEVFPAAPILGGLAVVSTLLWVTLAERGRR